jgi:hypothetical protein
MYKRQIIGGRVKDDLDHLISCYKLQESGPVLFFIRGEYEHFEECLNYLGVEINEGTIFGEPSIIQDIDQIDSKVIGIRDSLELEDPHSLCQRLTRRLNQDKYLVGIFIQKNGKLGRQLPIFFSNHVERFIEILGE